MLWRVISEIALLYGKWLSNQYNFALHMHLSSILLSIISVLIMLNGIVNSVIIAQYFGTSRDIEVYFAILVIYNAVYKISQVGQLNEFFLPKYLNTRSEESFEKATLDFAIVVNWMFLMSLILVSACYIFGEHLVAGLLSGFEASDKALGKQLLLLIAPLIILAIVNSVFKILINAERFYVESDAIDFASKVAFPITMLLCFAFYGLYSLVIALWVSQSLRLAMIFWLLYFKIGYRHSLCLKRDGFSFLKLYGQVLKLYSYMGATQVYVFVLNSLFTQMPQGSYAIIKYVETLFSALEYLINKPISIIFFTEFGRVKDDFYQRRYIAKKSLNFALLIFSLVFVIYGICGYEVLSVIWENDSFDSDDVEKAYRLLFLLMPLVLISAYGVLHRKVVVSLGYISWYYYLASFGQLICVCLVWLISGEPSSYDYVLLACINQMILMSVPFIIFKLKKITEHHYPVAFTTFTRIFFSAGMTFMLVWPLSLLFEYTALGKVALFGVITVFSVACLLLFYVFLYLMHLDEALDVYEFVKGRLAK